MTNPGRVALFVPGALSGAWIWQDNFAAAFVDFGFTVDSLQFPAHGAPWIQRHRQRFEDCVNLCAERAAQLETAPWVIGHSLGGLVALHAAARVPVSGLILLSPVPIMGIGRCLLQLAQHAPVDAAKLVAVMIDARISRFGRPPRGIYSPSCPTQRASSITARLRSESIPTLLRLFRPPRLDPNRYRSLPILMIGAQGDTIIPPTAVCRDAAVLGATTIVYEGLSHTFQAEAAWPDVARDIVSWIERQQVGPQSTLDRP